MRISDWSSDVCSSDLWVKAPHRAHHHRRHARHARPDQDRRVSARRHRRRHAARTARPRVSPNRRRYAMNGAAHLRRVPAALLFDGLTRVELTWIEKRIEYWIRFGRDVQEQILDRRQRVVSFPPHSVFAFVRWAANDFGTIISRIDILRAVSPGEPYQTLPFVRPDRKSVVEGKSVSVRVTLGVLRFIKKKQQERT